MFLSKLDLLISWRKSDDSLYRTRGRTPASTSPAGGPDIFIGGEHAFIYKL